MDGDARPVVAAGRIRVLLVEPRRIYADILAHKMRADDFVVAVACSEAAALCRQSTANGIIQKGKDNNFIRLTDRKTGCSA